MYIVLDSNVSRLHTHRGGIRFHVGRNGHIQESVDSRREDVRYPPHLSKSQGFSVPTLK